LLINSQSDMEAVGEESACAGCFERIRARPPDVLVTDAFWPSDQGLALISQIRQTCAKTRILLVSISDDAMFIRRSLEHGATGCIGRHASDAEVLSAIRLVAQGQMFVDSELAGHLIQGVLGRKGLDASGNGSRPGTQLSQREMEVLEYLVQGHTNQEIADRLYLSVKTAETYRARLKRKLGLRTRADIVRYAAEHGIATRRNESAGAPLPTMPATGSIPAASTL
jgi:DNA-binding NarL/FixJ family response regulator